MQNNRSMLLAGIVCFSLFVGLQLAIKRIWPDREPLPTQESLIAIGGGPVVATEPGSKMFRQVKNLEAVAANKEGEKKDDNKGNPVAPNPPVVVQPVNPIAPPELIAMGYGNKHSHLQILLNTNGAGVQQIVLPDFEEEDREGLAVPNEDANGFRKLHLVPGYLRERTKSLRAQRDIPYPKLTPGVVADDKLRKQLAPVSYTLFHYEKPTDDAPVDLLGKMPWKVIERPDTNADEQKTVFETELGAPYNLRIRKIFTLGRGDYHIGMRIEIQRQPGKKNAQKLRYQIVGANNLPIEGEWYASTYRTNIIGFVDSRDRATRILEDAASVRMTEGSDASLRSERELRFAGTMIQYFASVMCVDNQQAEGQKKNFLERVRSSPIGKSIADKPFLDDLTIRAVSEELDPEAPVIHQYMLYQGPVKVRLLKQLKDEKAVDPELVDRYKNTLHLEVMTDAPLPNALGRFANFIFWSDLVVMVTNVIHSLLGVLHSFIPYLGICIVCITVMVRGMMFPLSRKQTINQQIMQAKMAKIAPEVKKLQEKHGDDFQTFNQEKTKLMMQAGVNPATMMGGCFLVLMQMPIFMGLYYALQESVFFRLSPFLWMQNLGAPDMLAWWTESIPMISLPDGLGSGLYLGPYFNILPLITVSLMMYQQRKMMPVATTDQEKMQQSMMKFMMIFMAFMFYKSPSGLCLYFMASSIWSIFEKKLIPKFEKDEAGNITIPEQFQKKTSEKKELTGWRKKLKDRMKEVMEQAEKKQQHQRDPQQPQTPRSYTKKKRK